MLCAGLHPDALWAVFCATEPTLQNWARLRSVCKAWRDVATLRLVRHACIDSGTKRQLHWWERHRMQLTGLRSLGLMAAWQFKPTSDALDELTWHVCWSHPRGLCLDLLACARRLRVLQLHLPGAVTLRRLPDGALPVRFRLHLSTDDFCSIASLHAATVPSLKDLQLESDNFVQLPALATFASLQRLSLVAPGAAQLGPDLQDGRFTVREQVEVVAVTTAPDMIQGLQACTKAALIVIVPAWNKRGAVYYRGAGWEWRRSERQGAQLPFGVRLEVFADLFFQGMWDTSHPVSWLARQETLDMANTRCIWPLALAFS